MLKNFSFVNGWRAVGFLWYGAAAFGAGGIVLYWAFKGLDWVSWRISERIWPHASTRLFGPFGPSEADSNHISVLLPLMVIFLATIVAFLKEINGARGDGFDAEPPVMDEVNAASFRER